MASASHHVAQAREVAVVDIGAIELDHGAQLAQQPLPDRLHPEDFDRLDDVVAHDTRIVNLLVGTHNIHHVDSLSVQHPLALHLNRPGLAVDHLTLELAHEDTGNVLHTAQRQ